ncbi:reverse transcriptase domain-containing protein [Tanacetum coccineum]
MPPKAMSQAAIERLITQRVNAAVEAERARQVNAGGQGSNANEAGGQGGAPAVRECTFAGFMKCNPTVFHNMRELLNYVGGLRKLKWFSRSVIVWKRERLNLQLPHFKGVKDFDISAYTQRFHELVQLCPEMVPTERKKIEAYIRGLTDNIKGTVIGSKPTSLNEAGGNNGNRNNNRDNTRHNQQNNQRQGNVRAITTAPAEQGGYAGNKPLCNRCRKHHFGYCKVVCNNCGKAGHMARDCKGKAIATGANARPTVTCYDCREKGHTRNYCPKRKDPQGEEARGRAYVIKDTERQQEPICGLQITLLLNTRLINCVI